MADLILTPGAYSSLIAVKFEAGVSSITMTPAAATMSLSGTVQFHATGTWDDGGVSGIIDSQVSWFSSNSSIVTFNSTGLASYVSGNFSSIPVSCSFSGRSATSSLFVSGSPGVLAPILANAAGQLSNLYIGAAGQVLDTQARTWGVTGTLTTKAWTAQYYGGYGYFSGGNQTLANYITGTDAAVRLSGNFTMTFIAKASGTTRPTNNVLYFKNVATEYINLNQFIDQFQGSGGDSIEDFRTVQDTPFVLTVGRSGTTNYMKINQYPTVTGSAGTPVSGSELRIGGSNSANSFKGIIYSFWMTSSPFTEAAVSGNHTTAMQFMRI
jgi:hypothetical protein